MPKACGLAREADGHMWTSDPGDILIKRSTIDCIETVRFAPKDDNVKDIAWDGNSVWTISQSGRIISYSIVGDVENVIDDLLKDGWGLTWANGLLWASDPQNDSIYWISFYPEEPNLFLTERNIIDSLGNSNGRFDPGETVEIIVGITNRGGVEAVDIQGTLVEVDPHITILHGTCSFGTILTGKTTMNTTEPFVVYASDLVPEGHVVNFNLIVSTGSGYLDTLTVVIRVGLPQGDFLIWDPDPNHSSGPVIWNVLDSLNYSGEYTSTLTEYLGSLSRFSSIWVCLGQYPEREVISKNSIEADSLENYLISHSGRMYMEGSEVFYYDPIFANGYDFAPLFGIEGICDGGCDLGTIKGQKMTFTHEMSFPYSGENSWIDRLAPIPDSQSFAIFKNSNPEYFCGVACEGEDRRTVGVSFEFSGLCDITSLSNKKVLADSIMHFFGIVSGKKERRTPEVETRIILYNSKPNPLQSYAEIKFSLPKDSYVKLKLYDETGRFIKILKDGWMGKGIYIKGMDASGLHNGIYFLRLEVEGNGYTKKLIVVR